MRGLERGKQWQAAEVQCFGCFLKRNARAQQAEKSAPAVRIQPQQDQEFPRDEWRRPGRRQTHTEGSVEEVAFFIFRKLSFYRMNVTSALSHHILHQILVSCSCQYFFSHVFPLCIHLERFRLQGFFLNVPYIVFLPQWPNIFILTKTVFYKSQV